MSGINLNISPAIIGTQRQTSVSTENTKAAVESRGTPLDESGLLVDITSQIDRQYLRQELTPEQAKIQLKSALESDKTLGEEIQHGLEQAIRETKNDSIVISGPQASRWNSILELLIKAANDSAIANNTLSARFGTMSETSSKAAASAQVEQGLTILTKSIVSSGINIGAQGVALHSSINNYRGQKVNIKENMRGMHNKDLTLRKMENIPNSMSSDDLVKANANTSVKKVTASNGQQPELESHRDSLSAADKAANRADMESGNIPNSMSSDDPAKANANTPVKEVTASNGQQLEFESHRDSLSAADKAANRRNMEQVIAERDAFNAAYIQGDSRYTLQRAKIETQRGIGGASANIADGAGSSTVSMFQKEETEERAEAKVLDGAVEMTRQSAEKSAKMLADMMAMMSENRRAIQELGTAVGNNIKA
ncbi:hypothetical protein [Mixta mediterraneensis]|uniref:hypothetical protein n=1 Tax=Mixta mediterraneensis TaxID=2758443 RepID=UPI0018761BB0|nr:hypothetical protein [Mixta mediterraneensis]MBE5251935.1 hypothetical protein [Mixta mediterraneensis]